MAIGIEQNVLRLQVAVDKAVCVQVLESDYQFCSSLFESAFFLQVPEQLAARHIVCDKIELGRRLDRGLKADDERRI
jgi:hypothetical protein